MCRLKYALLFFVILTAGRGCMMHTADLSSVTKFDCLNQKQGRIVPGTPNIRILAHCDDYTFTDAKLTKALTLFIQHYSEEFDVPHKKMWSLLKSLKIELSVIPRSVESAFNIRGKPVTNVPVSGLALSKDHIWVEIKTKQIWSSSLTHELIHIIIWRSNQVHGDPDHEGSEYSGWSKKHTKFIKQFNKLLLELEI
jgi:hypothetical protein